MGKQSDTVKLTCPNHTQLLLDGIWTKYKQKEGTDLFIDINLQSSTEPIQVHALLLSILAPSFLQQQFNDSRCSLNVNYNIVATILELLYRGEVNVSEESIEELKRAAEVLSLNLVLEAIHVHSESPRQIVTRNLTKRSCNQQQQATLARQGRKRCHSSGEDEGSSISEFGYSDDDDKGNDKEDKGKKVSVTIKCPLCNFETSKQKLYSKHLSTKHRLDAKKNRIQQHFKCTTCNFTATTKEQLIEHHKSQHEKCKFQCTDCEFNTDKKKEFDRHINCYHSVDRPFKCHNCDYTARTLKLLTSHRKIHSGETFSCKVCSRTFTTKCYLDRHMKLHTNTEKKFACQFCSHKSRSRHDMDKHLRTLHSFVRPKPLETKPKSELPVGGYKCTHCEYKTRYRTCWVDHLASKHKVDPEGNTVVPSIKCKLCDFTCLVQYQLYTHMAKVHLEKRFKCQQCSYCSFRKADITLHMQSKHGNERPYMCETCGFRSKTQCDIRRHTLTHTIGKRFVCELCNKAYAFKYYLTKHMLRVHPKNDKQLRCCLCSYTTKTPQYLIGHTKRMHKEVEDPENAIQRAVVMDINLETNMNMYEVEPLSNLDQELPSCQQLPVFH